MKDIFPCSIVLYIFMRLYSSSSLSLFLRVICSVIEMLKPSQVGNAPKKILGNIIP